MREGLEPPVGGAQPCCPHLANPPAGCCPPPPPPPVLDQAYLPAQYLPGQAAIDLERAQHGTTTGPVVDESSKNGLPSDEECPVYPDLLQEAINNPNGCLYENKELEASLPHLPIERASSLDSIPEEGKDGGDIESGEPQTTKGASMRRRSSVYVREEVSKWKSLDTWRLWGISIWSEFLGTFLLVFIGCGIVVKGESTAVVALGFFLAVLIVIEAFVPFSGAQFNPVVSLVMCLCGVISPSLMLLHIVIQFVAGIAAAFMMKALIPGTAAADCAVAKVNADWHDGIGLFRAVCLEAFMTAVLIYVVLNAGFHKKSRARNALSTFAVASTVAALVIIGGDLTGTSINPARSLGPALACNYWDYQWVYFVGPPVGGVLAWIVYAVTHHRSQR